MQKYRKKPVVVEAVQWTPSEVSVAEIQEWAGGAMPRIEPAGSWADGSENGYDLLIPTTEGKMLCRPGWWIIKGVEGECYPCAPTVFDATYEAVAKENDA